MTSPKEAMKEKLDRFSGNGGSRDSAGRRIPRVLIMGNVIDKPNLFIMVEDSGAAVVAFDTCCGLRHYSLPAQGGPDPMVSLAQSYLLRPQCPRMPGFQGRLDRLDELVQAYSADGIIYSTVKFCDYGLLEAPLMERHLRKNRIPFLFLENDYLWGDEGRLRTRVEAFVEIIQGEVG
jgi:benzoyl-CoA reductase/2-hydroxyglutaryl-CoA dehydratase subunit BcrC/BadD/HgdB